MGNTEKFLMLFSDFDMVVVEKTDNPSKKSIKNQNRIKPIFSRSLLKKLLKD